METRDRADRASNEIEHVLKPGYDFSDSFEFGLDLIIRGLDEAAKEPS